MSKHMALHAPWNKLPINLYNWKVDGLVSEVYISRTAGKIYDQVFCENS